MTYAEFVIECQETRSQGQNREKALKMLKSQLYEIELRKKREKIAVIESGKRRSNGEARSAVMCCIRTKW